MRPDLAADCGRCAALCCVHTSFEASDEFAFTRPLGVACRHLRRDHRCAIHDDLVASGMSGCAAYDCHGAGPRATRLFAATLLTPDDRSRAFLRLREIHELLWVLDGAAALAPDPALDAAIAALDALADAPARALLAADVAPHRAEAERLLRPFRAPAGARVGT